MEFNTLKRDLKDMKFFSIYFTIIEMKLNEQSNCFTFYSIGGSKYLKCLKKQVFLLLLPKKWNKINSRQLHESLSPPI